MSSLSSIKSPIKKELETFDKMFKKSLDSGVPLLNIILKYITRNRGKQIRPTFVFLTCKMFGEINSSTYTAATLIELLHNATIIHDDVVDESFERRGIFSINALWKSKVAVLVGDYLLSRGLLLSLDNDEYEQLKIVSEAVKQMSEGEIQQIKNSRKLFVSKESYFDVISKKTASLIASCMACGALSAGCSETDILNAKKIGYNAGIAFQIKDDLFDYDHKNISGKPAANDIKEKKITLPLLYAYEKSSKDDQSMLRSLIKNHNNNKRKIKKIIEYAHEKGGVEYATLQMNEYKNKALLLLKDFPDSTSKKSLEELIEFITFRKR